MKIEKVPSKALSEKKNLLDALNRVQAEAARTVQGPLLILAGAGSGKTRVLTYRVAYLLSQGVEPESILALTFTNKAAREMKERIGSLVDAAVASRLWVGTFHSIFLRMLRVGAEAIGYTSSFSIYDADDSLALVKTCMEALAISPQQIAPQAVRSAISQAKNREVGWQQFGQEAGSAYDRQVAQIYKEYQRRLKMNNAMDFDDILLNTIALLNSSEEQRQRWQKKFRYVLVDEYQDTNRAQYHAVTLLGGAHRNICVVGDDAQSIYKWRGADIRNILDFEKDYPDAAVVRLEQNYRSTKVILDAANDVISNNRQQMKKKLWTANDDGAPLGLVRCKDERHEAERVAQLLRRHRENGVAWSGMAILYRTNAQSQPLEEALRRAGIPYTLVGNVSFYKRKEIKDVLAYWKLVVNASDDESFYRVINEPARGIGKTSLRHLAYFAEKHGISLLEACTRTAEIADLQQRIRKSFGDFAGMVARYAALHESVPADELAKMILDASGLVDYYREQQTQDASDRLENIYSLLGIVGRFRSEKPEARLADMLQEIMLIDTSDEAEPAEDDTVRMMTVHAAKGLEFPVVLLTGLEEGLFPMTRDKETDEIEEERRLMYVAITRAMQRLYLFFSEMRYRFGQLSYQRISPFVEEISESRIEPVDSYTQYGGGQYRTANSRPGSRGAEATPLVPLPPPAKKSTPLPSSRAAAPAGRAAARPAAAAAPRKAAPQYNEFRQFAPEEQNALRPRMKVRHALFGEGVVKSVSGSGDSLQVSVEFPRVGLKKLMAKFANLQVIG